MLIANEEQLTCCSHGHSPSSHAQGSLYGHMTIHPLHPAGEILLLPLKMALKMALKMVKQIT